LNICKFGELLNLYYRLWYLSFLLYSKHHQHLPPTAIFSNMHHRKAFALIIHNFQLIYLIRNLMLNVACYYLICLFVVLLIDLLLDMITKQSLFLVLNLSDQ
uniref:Ovule protein n=1 Tax=Brugia timori TaxID=42155 RepID=A0A0R3Q739_9BILA